MNIHTILASNTYAVVSFPRTGSYTMSGPNGSYILVEDLDAEVFRSTLDLIASSHGDWTQEQVAEYLWNECGYGQNAK